MASINLKRTAKSNYIIIKLLKFMGEIVVFANVENTFRPKK